MGGICSFFKEDIIISLKGVLLLFVICLCCWMTPLKESLFYVFFIYTLLFLFQTKLSRQIVLPGDYSYGVYIYGFPVQQAINAMAPNHTPLLNAVLSVPCTLVLGVISWHLIEKPCLAFASHFKSSNNNKIQEISVAALYNIAPKNLIFALLLVPVPFIIYKIYNL